MENTIPEKEVLLISKIWTWDLSQTHPTHSWPEPSQGLNGYKIDCLIDRQVLLYYSKKIITKNLKCEQEYIQGRGMINGSI